MCAYVVLRDKVLKPMLAGAAPRGQTEPPKNLSPLDAHYLALQREMNRTFETLGLPTNN